MLSLFLGTIAFFVSTVYVKRYLESAGVAKGAARGVLIFAIALVIALVVAYGVGRLPL